jgi:hypothetical protein
MDDAGPERVSDQIERWSHGDAPRTLASLVDAFEEKAFAVVFVILLGVPALPLPTGGATHVFEVIAMLLSLQLILGRGRVWLPRRWRGLRLDRPRQRRFLQRLVGLIRRLERFSNPRLAPVFDHRVANSVFGVLILALSLGAFLAPPFTGLDTLPALGAVLVSLGVLLEDLAVVAVGVAVGGAGVFLEVLLGRAAFHGIEHLL